MLFFFHEFLLFMQCYIFIIHTTRGLKWEMQLLDENLLLTSVDIKEDKSGKKKEKIIS